MFLKYWIVCTLKTKTIFSSVSSDVMNKDAYYLNSQYHAATVERFHNVIRANIHVLGQVNNLRIIGVLSYLSWDWRFWWLPPTTNFLHLSVILFTVGVCHTLRANTPTPPPPTLHLGRHPPRADTPPGSACWDTFNRRAVRIILECNLVYFLKFNKCFVSCRCMNL